MSIKIILIQRSPFTFDHFLLVVVFLAACIKDGKEAYGSDCYIKRHDQRKFVMIADK